MGRSNRHATKGKPNIQCLEVLISRSDLQNNNNNLFWTLSVYSLQNQPVKKNRGIHNSEVFHFMDYDWKRTIENMLIENQVPFSIIRYFSRDSIYSDTLNEVNIPDNEVTFLSAFEGLSGGHSPATTQDAKAELEENADLLQ